MEALAKAVVVAVVKAVAAEDAVAASAWMPGCHSSGPLQEGLNRALRAATSSHDPPL